MRSCVPARPVRLDCTALHFLPSSAWRCSLWLIAASLPNLHARTPALSSLCRAAERKQVGTANMLLSVANFDEALKVPQVGTAVLCCGRAVL